MIYDCLIIGGGPAGANTALVLGRAKLTTLLIDNNTARNRVTHESHGFITNDSLSPQIIRDKALADLKKYPTIDIQSDTVLAVEDKGTHFEITTNQTSFLAKKVILATGFQEKIPEISNLKNLYGKKFFNCMFCDGWELRDQALAVISKNSSKILEFVTMISHWSKDLRVFSNGSSINEADKNILLEKNIFVDESPIQLITEKKETIEITTQDNSYLVSGGFISPTLQLRLNFMSDITLDLTDSGILSVNEFGETSYPNIYAAGDLQMYGGQLVHAASTGSKVASSIVRKIAFENF